mmetsp:Transcript_4201/g.12029  ORF Transcript_4201/g.12029 Transcript_4201/m.12029 type:complete len:295 (-) Transcript_4201:2128-3012(-)
MQRATFTQDAHHQRTQRFQFPNHAVTAIVLAMPSASLAQCKFMQQDGITTFEDLRIGDSRVGAMRVHSGASVPLGTGSGASCDGLVVPKLVITERQVVHAALAGGACGERLQHHIHDPLRCQHVAPHNARIGRRVQQCVLGNDEFDRCQATLVERDGLSDERSQRVNHGAVSHGRWRIVISQYLRSGSGEVERGTPAVRIDRDRQRDRRSVVHEIDCLGGRSVFLGKLLQHVADGLFRISLDEEHVGLDDLEAVLVHQFLQQSDSGVVGSNLSTQVAQVVTQIAGAKVARQLAR